MILKSDWFKIRFKSFDLLGYWKVGPSMAEEYCGPGTSKLDTAGASWREKLVVVIRKGAWGSSPAGELARAERPLS